MQLPIGLYRILWNWLTVTGISLSEVEITVHVFKYEGSKRPVCTQTVRTGVTNMQPKWNKPLSPEMPGYFSKLSDSQETWVSKVISEVNELPIHQLLRCLNRWTRNFEFDWPSTLYMMCFYLPDKVAISNQPKVLWLVLDFCQPICIKPLFDLQCSSFWSSRNNHVMKHSLLAFPKDAG